MNTEPKPLTPAEFSNQVLWVKKIVEPYMDDAGLATLQNQQHLLHALKRAHATIAERDRRIAELEKRTDAPSAEEWEELARIKIPGQRSAPVKLRAFVETDVEFQWDMDRWVARIHATEQQTIDHAIPSEILTYGWHKPEE